MIFIAMRIVKELVRSDRRGKRTPSKAQGSRLAVPASLR
jgi:hypothetical protein